MADSIGGGLVKFSLDVLGDCWQVMKCQFALYVLDRGRSEPVGIFDAVCYLHV